LKSVRQEEKKKKTSDKPLEENRGRRDAPDLFFYFIPKENSLCRGVKSRRLKCLFE